MTRDEFFEGLTKAGWGEAEAIEAEACAIFREGWTKEVAGEFIRTLIELRRGSYPEAGVPGLIEMTLQYGLSAIRYATGLDSPPPKSKAKRKSKLSGAGV